MIMRITLLVFLIILFRESILASILSVCWFLYSVIQYLEGTINNQKVIVEHISLSEEELLDSVHHDNISSIIILLEYKTVDEVIEWTSSSFNWESDYSYRVVNAINKKYKVVYEN